VIGDGFRVDTRIMVEAIEDAVLVLVSALCRRGAGWAAHVVQDGVARVAVHRSTLVERWISELRRWKRFALDHDRR
jgi:hypothetical protein